MNLVFGEPSLEESCGSSSWSYEWSQPYVGDSGRRNRVKSFSLLWYNAFLKIFQNPQIPVHSNW